eukprot:9319042-Alexandrium_andersonii.AAC.1
MANAGAKRPTASRRLAVSTCWWAARTSTETMAASGQISRSCSRMRNNRSHPHLRPMAYCIGPTKVPRSPLRCATNALSPTRRR